LTSPKQNAKASFGLHFDYLFPHIHTRRRHEVKRIAFLQERTFWFFGSYIGRSEAVAG
jgi:hypothetical protein